MATFKTEEEAINWMHKEIGFDPYMDNIRIGYVHDLESLEEYGRIYNNGCCGYFDSEHITIGGRLAFIGCNYGH